MVTRQVIRIGDGIEVELFGEEADAVADSSSSPSGSTMVQGNSLSLENFSGRVFIRQLGRSNTTTVSLQSPNDAVMTEENQSPPHQVSPNKTETDETSHAIFSSASPTNEMHVKNNVVQDSPSCDEGGTHSEVLNHATQKSDMHSAITPAIEEEEEKYEEGSGNNTIVSANENGKAQKETRLDPVRAPEVNVQETLLDGLSSCDNGAALLENETQEDASSGVVGSALCTVMEEDENASTSPDGVSNADLDDDLRYNLNKQETSSSDDQMGADLPSRPVTHSFVNGSDFLHKAQDSIVAEQSHSGRSQWVSLLRNVQSVKKFMPSQMKAGRAALRAQSSDNGGINEPPSRLHTLCALPDTSLQDFLDEIENNPQSVSMKDTNGNLPLHILGDNDDILSTAQGKFVATSAAERMMQVYPESITTENNEGNFPFFALIQEWCLWTYGSQQQAKPKHSIISPKGAAKLFVDKLVVGVTVGVDRMANSIKGPENSSDTNAKSASTQLSEISVKSFPRVELWKEVEWCFNMLSLALDELGGKSGPVRRGDKREYMYNKDQNVAARETLVSHLLTMVPGLFKTILLLEEEGGDVRDRLLKLSIFRRSMLCSRGTGSWLVEMLQQRGIPATRAVDFLELVSHTTIDDFVGGYRSPDNDDSDGFRESKQSVFDSIREVEGIIASLILIGEKETERAAATPVVWDVMSHNLSRPFVVGLVLIDFVLHLTLMLAFRTDVQCPTSSRAPTLGVVPTQVVLFICSHYFIRKLCEALSLFTLSVSVFQAYFANIWTIFDFIAIIMTLTTVTWSDNNPGEYRQGLNAFVLGLLWVKVLGFLKVVNKQMSTFIMALIQILKDLRHFALVLMTIIFMFGDMMHVVLSTKENCEYCLNNEGTLSGPGEDFCSDRPQVYYLRVYGVLIGDYQLDDYRQSRGMTALFVIFTLVGVIVLLNVLIAVISDSYEKAKIGSLLLFGRARVTFVAQNEALERFLRPGNNPIDGILDLESPRKAFKVLGRMCRWFVLLTLIATAMNAEIFLTTRAVDTIRHGLGIGPLIVILFLSIILTIAIWVVFSFAFGSMMRQCTPTYIARGLQVLDYWSNIFAQALGSRIFGLDRKGSIQNSLISEVSDKGEEEWTGRLGYLERAFVRELSKMKEEVKGELLALETRLYEHEELLKESTRL